MKTNTFFHKLKHFLMPNAQDIALIDDNEYSKRFGNFYSAQLNNQETVDVQELSEDEYNRVELTNLIFKNTPKLTYL